MAAHDDIPDEAESKANDTDEDEMLDAKEHLDEDLGKKIEIFIAFFLNLIFRLISGTRSVTNIFSICIVAC